MSTPRFKSPESESLARELDEMGSGMAFGCPLCVKVLSDLDAAKLKVREQGGRIGALVRQIDRLKVSRDEQKHLADHFKKVSADRDAAYDRLKRSYGELAAELIMRTKVTP